ncbi:hypothetical protein CYMTET_19194 [Cymbomonas tetramitiformis]|uniref:Uncharacterized protein n=1 Tax=Cymbomonas tetramitiformis TaxID=36881 RepID=A0AAE0G6M6_9CHLO|nr:hypothetical protein CYMTET_19194 [Cymbomonas tetramitiformis]
MCLMQPLRPTGAEAEGALASGAEVEGAAASGPEVEGELASGVETEGVRAASRAEAEAEGTLASGAEAEWQMERLPRTWVRFTEAGSNTLRSIS